MANNTKSDKAKEILDGVSQSVAELEKKIGSPETEKTIREWLQFQSQFHDYSFYNTFFLYVQAYARNYQLERVASFKKWTEFQGENGERVSIQKGAKGFAVLFPFQQIRYELDDKGNFILDHKGEKVPQLDENGNVKKTLLFGHGYVFDVKQTNAKEVGAYKTLNHRGEAFEIDSSVIDEIAARITSKYKIPVEFKSVPGKSAGGWYSPLENSITVNTAVVDQFSSHALGTLFHELGHAVMHGKESPGMSTEAKEGQAEAFAYAAVLPFGIVRQSELYIKSWISDEVPLEQVLKDISSHVRKAYSELGIAELAAKMSMSQEQDELSEMSM